MTAAPLCVLPAKDTVEELFWKEEGLNKKINALVTLALVFVCFLLSIMIDKIGDAITLAGATINPVVIISTSLNHLDRIHYPRDLLLESERVPTYQFQRKNHLSSLSRDHHCGINHVSWSVHLR